MPHLEISEELKQGLIVCDRAGHSNSLCFVGIHGYFSLAQSHISMQTEGREAEERPGVWCAAAPCKIWRQTEELAVNKRKSYQCGQVRGPVDTSLQERKLLKSQQSRVRKQGGHSLSNQYNLLTARNGHCRLVRIFNCSSLSRTKARFLSTSHDSGFINEKITYKTLC